jgi:flagellar basal body rod protein FlgF
MPPFMSPAPGSTPRPRACASSPTTSANVNTTGFQRERAEFQTLSYQTMTAPGAASSGDSRYAIGQSLGSGVQMTGVARIGTQGPLQATDNPYDMAIQGDGFFQIQSPTAPPPIPAPAISRSRPKASW